MEEAEVKHVLEAALLAAGRPLSIDKLLQLFVNKGPAVDRSVIRRGLDALSADYAGRGLQLKEVASGYRIQIKASMTNWLQPIWEERPPRYTRALLETLALVVYRQPVTRGDIEEVRGVAVSPNIIRTLLERGWIRVVGHKDVPGKPEMFGTTREFLDYFGLKSLDDLPTLADIREGLPEVSPQTDLIDSLEIALGGQTDDALPELLAAEADDTTPEDEQPALSTAHVTDPADQSVETSDSSESDDRQAHPRGTDRGTLGSN